MVMEPEALNTLYMYIATYPSLVRVASLCVDALVVHYILINIMDIASLTTMIAIWHYIKECNHKHLLNDMHLLPKPT